MASSLLGKRKSGNVSRTPILPKWSHVPVEDPIDDPSNTTEKALDSRQGHPTMLTGLQLVWHEDLRPEYQRRHLPHGSLAAAFAQVAPSMGMSVEFFGAPTFYATYTDQLLRAWQVTGYADSIAEFEKQMQQRIKDVVRDDDTTGSAEVAAVVKEATAQALASIKISTVEPDTWTYVT